MRSDKMMNVQTDYFPDLDLIDELVFKPCRFHIKNRKPEAESQEYSAQRFELNEKHIIFRVAKITPTKTGQFVSIWKRNERGITAPFHLNDEFDYLIIATKTSSNFGIFIFPKSILQENKIISAENHEGKRGIRVYPGWDETTNKQAQKTQTWQKEYFLDLSDSQNIDFCRIKNLFKTK